MNRLACAGTIAALLWSAACGGNGTGAEAVVTSGAMNGAQTTGGAGGVGATGSGGSASTSVAGSGGMSGSATSAAGPSASSSASGGGSNGLADVGTLVVLGDSISDGGGQGPFYYQLLRSSLEAFYSHPINYQNKAQSGSKTGALVAQVGALPKSLPGPVAVTITSGGNDLKDSLALILGGLDGPARMQMGSNIDSAIKALLVPGRFGAGVKVQIFYASIYDASDGKGNYKDGGCVVKVNSPGSVDGYFASWNAEIAGRVGGQAQTLADLHGKFLGHGFNNPPNWYASDCTHPNSTGHAKVRDMFHQHITGKAAP